MINPVLVCPSAESDIAVEKKMKKSFACQHCDYRTSKEKRLTRHIPTHFVPQPDPAHNEALQDHLPSLHPPPSSTFSSENATNLDGSFPTHAIEMVEMKSNVVHSYSQLDSALYVKLKKEHHPVSQNDLCLMQCLHALSAVTMRLLQKIFWCCTFLAAILLEMNLLTIRWN
eukprot:TRINITY_DN4707_c0_g1::TRINITY_DN4707_c0_g1_i1::g.21359::m.21359 TRINITY_DN4707_c0_g1::TRINITY_DN4707_c0_g1_i1::g.21359  ORF type:complete len:171 (-),score=13.71,zf-H2C2_5/PF13909.1/9.9e-05,zf-H2C2_5/PF13909.1/1.3e+04,zf-H2C2_2/PF13465.1/1.5,zf-H2C2_2/PF13465.1/4.7e+02,zf-H2C2_2/PF13465.1/5.9e+03 TRINITY_DN4707_c0_g1_i1:91-603(-)